FSQLEYTLKHYVAEKVGLDDVHFNSIMTHDFAILCNIAEAVLLQGPEPTDWGFPRAPDSSRKDEIKKDHQTEKLARAKRLKALLNGCRKLNVDRVRVVHGLWAVGHGSGTLFHVSRQELTNSTHFRQADDLAKKADTACRLRDEIPKVIYSA